MCLDLSLFPFLRGLKTAKKPIKVYKLAGKRESASGEVGYVTPFQKYTYFIGDTHVSELKVSRWDSARVEVGIHSLMKFKNAVKIAHALHESCVPVALLECEIPVGSEYYVGGWRFRDSTFNSIASNQLKVVREVLIPPAREGFLSRLVGFFMWEDRFI